MADTITSENKSSILSRSSTSFDSDHKLTFGVVYANDIAAAEITAKTPTFPVGSIIVRERNASEFSTRPMTVIAMVKREKGFSKETGDWEFITLRGEDLSLQNRATVGDCASCHSKATDTDWVFRDYLK